MISPEFMGRLGNILFQIGSAYGLAKANGDTAVFPAFKESQYFDYDFTPQEFTPAFIHEQKQFHYYKRPYQKGLLLKGYYQSSKFFEGYGDDIKKMFTLKPEYRRMLPYEVTGGYPTCSIHVRRGDYLTLEQFHPTQTMKYFDEAIEIIKSKHDNRVIFFVFSDDLPWCQQQFGGRPDVNIVNPEFRYGISNEGGWQLSDGTAISDFVLMTNCQHHIISNSSFSWWTAYLNPGITVAPRRWFGPALSHETQDIYEKDWITI